MGNIHWQRTRLTHLGFYKILFCLCSYLSQCNLIFPPFAPAHYRFVHCMCLICIFSLGLISWNFGWAMLCYIQVVFWRLVKYLYKANSAEGIFSFSFHNTRMGDYVPEKLMGITVLMTITILFIKCYSLVLNYKNTLYIFVIIIIIILIEVLKFFLVQSTKIFLVVSSCRF